MHFFRLEMHASDAISLKIYSGMRIKGHTPYIIVLFGIVGNNYGKRGGFVMNFVRIWQSENYRIDIYNINLNCHCGSALILHVLVPSSRPALALSSASLLAPHLRNCRHAFVASWRVVQQKSQPVSLFIHPHSLGDGSYAAATII